MKMIFSTMFISQYFRAETHVNSSAPYKQHFHSVPTLCVMCAVCQWFQVCCDTI